MGQRPARRKCRPRHARMLGAATRGTKKEPTGLIAYPAAQGRAVSGCGSQRMLHALERRSHPADHGPSFASLYSPFCRYATSSPDRGKSLLAGGGQLSCNSRTGQIKNPPSECSGSNHIRHSYRMGLATTTTAASGRCREELLGQRPARRKCRPRHARMLGAATRGTKKEPTGLFFAACGRPCSFDSSYGLHETATTLDIPGRWDPRTKQQPTGLIAYPAAQGRAVQVLLSAPRKDIRSYVFSFFVQLSNPNPNQFPLSQPLWLGQRKQSPSLPCS